MLCSSSSYGVNKQKFIITPHTGVKGKGICSLQTISFPFLSLILRDCFFQVPTVKNISATLINWIVTTYFLTLYSCTSKFLFTRTLFKTVKRILQEIRREERSSSFSSINYQNEES